MAYLEKPATHVLTPAKSSFLLAEALHISLFVDVYSLLTSSTDNDSSPGIWSFNLAKPCQKTMALAT